MAVMTESEVKVITDDAPSTTTNAFFPYPEDPFKEVVFRFSLTASEMGAITGPFPVTLWGYTPGGKWMVIDQWVLEDIPGPVGEYATSALAFTHYYLQAENAADDGDYSVFMAYEPGSGVKQ